MFIIDTVFIDFLSGDALLEYSLLGRGEGVLGQSAHTALEESVENKS